MHSAALDYLPCRCIYALTKSSILEITNQTRAEPAIAMFDTVAQCHHSSTR